MSFPRNAPKGDIRAFVAVGIERPQREALTTIERALAKELSSDVVRWLQPEQLHLTLRFLGNVPEEKITELAHALEKAAAGLPAFSLALENLGCFPSARRPNVIWVGLAGELEALRQVQERVARSAAPYSSHTESRPFQPHLTIGRIRAGARGLERVGPALDKIRFPRTESWRVGAVHLMKSVLQPKGAVYTCLATVSLTDQSGT